MKEKRNITGIILAGGKSSRMGVDKGFISWNGQPFIQYSINALQPLVNNIFIVSDHPQYDNLDYTRVADIFPESGPLSGLYSGLQMSKNALNLVLSCDIPQIQPEVLEIILNAYTEGTNAVICTVENRVMPLVGLYHTNCIVTCEKLLRDNERRMMCLLDQLDKVTYVALNQEQAQQVKNINNRTDLNNIKNAS